MLIAIRWIAGSSASAQDPSQTSDVANPQSVTTRPDLELAADSPIRKWFIALADADPQVRDQASEDLMGISGDDLPKLRQLVIESQPLVPDQTAALKDIVTQAYLASQKYDVTDGKQTDPSGGQGPFFLGLLWPLDTGSDPRLGVPVDERIPGFPSYRFLHRGDMIMGIFINPSATLMQFPNTETHNIDALKSAISTSPAAQDIALQVLRNGQVLKLRLKMAPRPLYADPANPGALRQFTADRAADADRYWNENFARLLGHDPVEEAE
jgi:hypothetical protein